VVQYLQATRQVRKETIMHRQREPPTAPATSYAAGVNGDHHPTKLRLREAREAAVRTLSEGFARDEIGLDAFDERIERAYRAESIAELARLTSDLTPVEADVTSTEAVLVATIEPPRIVSQSDHVDPAGRLVASATLGSVEREGPLSLSGHVRARAVLGSLVVDLRDVRLGPGVTELRLDATFGSIEIFVPADLSVELEAGALLGSVEGRSRLVPDADPDAPVLRIVGRALFGSIEVVPKAPRHLLRQVEQRRGVLALPAPASADEE
jgi:hypothetical protein